MKKLLLVFLIVVPNMVVAQAIKLDLCKTSQHFTTHCSEADHEVVDEMIKQNEELFQQLSHDFKHQYSKKIIFNVYPDLTSLHHAIKWPDAPDWVIGQDGDNIINNVSPNNPGPLHTYDSVMKASKVGLVILFIFDKYSHHELIPRWFHQGVALYKAQFFPNKLFIKLAQDLSSLPTLEQLENISKDNSVAFDKLDGFRISFSLIAFIDKKWGWQAVLELLEDYSRFEAILQITKQEFEEKWHQFLVSEAS